MNDFFRLSVEFTFGALLRFVRAEKAVSFPLPAFLSVQAFFFRKESVRASVFRRTLGFVFKHKMRIRFSNKKGASRGRGACAFFRLGREVMFCGGAAK